MSKFFSGFTNVVRRYPLLFLLGLCGIMAVAYVLYPVEETREALAPQGEGDRVYFGGDTTVTQEFKSEKGLTSISIPVGGNAPLPGPLILHIRPVDGDDDIAVSPIFSLRDEVATFRFKAIKFTPQPGRWVLEAPHSPAQSFWVYREQDASAFTEGEAFVGSRIMRGNFGFSQVWTRPRILSSQRLFEPALVGWWMRGAAVLGLLGAIVWYLTPVKYRDKLWRREIWVLSGILALGFLLHMDFAASMPIVNDEGAYIQDVMQMDGRLLPFRDYLTKGPAYLACLWLWHLIIPNTMLAWRLFSAIAWVLAGIGFWLCMKEWGLNPKARISASAAFSLMPAAISLTVPLLLQTASVPVSLFALWLVLRAVNSQSSYVMAASAALMGLGFFIRVSTVVPAFMGLMLIVVLAKPRLKLVAVYVVTGVLLFSVVFGAGVAVMGLEKAAIMVNAEALLISRTRQEKIEAASVREPLIRSVVIESRVLWRAGLPYMAALLIWPVIFMTRRYLTLTGMLGVLGMYIVWQVWMTLVDTDYLLPGNYWFLQQFIVLSVAILPLVALVVSLLYQPAGPLLSKEHRASLFALFWLVATGFIYGQWGRFRQSYWVEFLAALSLLLGLVGVSVATTWSHTKPHWLRISGNALFFILSMAWVLQGYGMAWKYPHTGTVAVTSLHDMVGIIRDIVPRGEVLFTAQPILTAFAERPIMFGYSHPGWYREARVGSLPVAMRDLLFLPPEAITDYLRTEARYVFLDHRTDEIYFDGYPERRQLLADLFLPVGSVGNDVDGDTWVLYRRK
ncbi:MAG: glycosyltransferase family 39 protein [Candidatus Andersenbacteria bacterium]|nr:glycosyltransferase family 39 protein [Candidatus Andersenbacteria bacterium]